MRYFLAGGAVRDTLLGRRPSEFDVVFDGTPEEVARLCGNAPRVGKTVATYIVDGHDYMPLRGTIQEDILARDCTINALLLDANGVLHAHPATFSDLRDGIVRHASPASFRRDPVRVFRAARFTATLPGFSIHPETAALMRETAEDGSFAAIAAERVGNECMKAMAGPVPGNFLQALANAGALAPWLAPMDKAAGIPAGPPQYHGGNSVLAHTAAVMDTVAKSSVVRAMPKADRALAVWMAFCHDLGKLVTPPDMLPRHIGHESAGEPLAAVLARRLRLPKRWEKAGRLAALLHMKAGRYPSLKVTTRVDLLQQLSASRLFEPFRAVVAADAGDEAAAIMMRRDMEAMLAVALPAAWRDRGSESASELRRLRIRALRRTPSSGQELDP